MIARAGRCWRWAYSRAPQILLVAGVFAVACLAASSFYLNRSIQQSRIEAATYFCRGQEGQNDAIRLILLTFVPPDQQRRIPPQARHALARVDCRRKAIELIRP